MKLREATFKGINLLLFTGLVLAGCAGDIASNKGVLTEEDGQIKTRDCYFGSLSSVSLKSDQEGDLMGYENELMIDWSVNGSKPQ